MKVKVYPHVTSAVDFINTCESDSVSGLSFLMSDLSEFMQGAVCLNPIELQFEVDSNELRRMALEQIEKAEEATKAELLEKLNKLKEEKEKLLAITHQV